MKRFIPNCGKEESAFWYTLTRYFFMMSDEHNGQEEQDTMGSSVPPTEQDIDNESVVEVNDEGDVAATPEDVVAPVTDTETDEAVVSEVEATEVVVEADVVEEVVEAEAEVEDDKAVVDVEEVAESEPETEAETEADEVVSEDDEVVVEVEASDEKEEAPKKPAPRFRRGDLIEGTVVKTTPIFIEVDLGEELIGVVPGRELERMTRASITELEEGQKITVYVVNPRDHQGKVVLSVNRALEEMDWKTAEEYRKSQQVYEGQVAGYNKGGLIVRFGRLRGFVPQSQIGEDRRRGLEGDTPEARYGSLVYEDIVVKVMEVDRSRNRLILSERAASRERRERRKESLIKELGVGEVREGRVVSLEDFGAFVDIGGAEGLVHLTEISWKHVVHPRDTLKIGQKVRAEVISVDPNRKRIGLSIKRQEADPWDEVATTYQEGDLVQGLVTKLTKFGAFAQLVAAQNIEGLIHISELSDQRVKHPRDVVEEGEKLTLRVVKIDVKNRRLGLSLKRVNSAEYLDRDMKSTFMVGSPEAEDETPVVEEAVVEEVVEAEVEPVVEEEVADEVVETEAEVVVEEVVVEEVVEAEAEPVVEEEIADEVVAEADEAPPVAEEEAPVVDEDDAEDD
jgi:small subunit ribosomal protein S1